MHLQEEEILAEKIRAFLVRVKGRDIFDLWYLLEKGVRLELKTLDRKLKVVNRNFDIGGLIKKIEEYPQRKIEIDLARFLPRHQREIIPYLKEKTNALLRTQKYLLKQNIKESLKLAQ